MHFPFCPIVDFYRFQEWNAVFTRIRESMSTLFFRFFHCRFAARLRAIERLNADGTDSTRLRASRLRLKNYGEAGFRGGRQDWMRGQSISHVGNAVLDGSAIHNIS